MLVDRYFKKEGAEVINTWVIDEVCTLEDLSIAQKSKQKNTFLLAHIQGHHKTRLHATAPSSEEHAKWVSALKRVISGALKQELATTIRARSDIVQFEELVENMFMAAGDAADSDEFYINMRKDFSSVEWGVDTVKFKGNSLVPTGQVTALKKIVTEMKQYEAAQAERTVSVSPRKRRDSVIARRKSARNSRNSGKTEDGRNTFF